MDGDAAQRIAAMNGSITGTITSSHPDCLGDVHDAEGGTSWARRRWSPVPAQAQIAIARAPDHHALKGAEPR